MIQREHERKGARARQPAVGRLQPEQSAERRRHADGAVGVGAERERHEIARDRAAGAARRAASHARHVVRIARRTIVHVLAGEVVGVLAHVQCTDENGSRSLQPLDQHGVTCRGLEFAVDLRSCARRQTLDVEQVLDCERNAGEGPRGLPAAIAASTAVARSIARSAVTSVKALSSGFLSAIRAERRRRR